MKHMILTLFLLPLTSQAAQYVFEPFVDASYGCNYMEGQNSMLPLSAKNLEEAIAEAKVVVGSTLTINCNRDEYVCAHGDGDVEPKPVVFSSEPKSYQVLGGRVWQSNSGVAYVNELGYHLNLRRLPRCRY